MIDVAVSNRNFESDPKISEYVREKMGALEKFLPRGVREAVSCTVVLEDDVSGREDNRYVCDVVMVVPGAKLVAREGTVNMFAAIDIVEAKLRAQLTKYKDKHAGIKRGGRLGELAEDTTDVEPAD